MYYLCITYMSMYYPVTCYLSWDYHFSILSLNHWPGIPVTSCSVTNEIYLYMDSRFCMCMYPSCYSLRIILPNVHKSNGIFIFLSSVTVKSGIIDCLLLKILTSVGNTLPTLFYALKTKFICSLTRRLPLPVAVCHCHSVWHIKSLGLPLHYNIQNIVL